MVKFNFVIKGTAEGLKKELSKRLVDEPAALAYAVAAVDKEMEKIPLASLEVRVDSLIAAQGGRAVNAVQAIITPMDAILS